ncbi:MAG: DUF1501 domain-containing protein [Dehalococcoidia bacterium]|nr:DUF1501 domain-containing protein [Dehalococcoidia bacterium]
MASNGNERERVIVVLSLSGGNDGLNTLIPYNNPTYYDYRNTLGISEDQVIRINDEVGFHPSMTELKGIYDQGNMAVIQGVGYPNPSRSHFRSMDIWHTCEPDTIGSEGWLGRTIRDLDPNHENVLTGVNFGRGLPRALAAPGVPVASVGNLATYGLLTGIPGEEERSQALDIFSRMYSPAIGSGPIMDYIWETGRSALKGADILKVAPEMYSSSVEYGNYPIAQGMRGIAQVHFADLGTRILYTTSPYNSFDTHANQAGDHARLWRQVSETVSDFYEDLKEHHRGDEVLLFMFSEFGRRARDNGGGTDHGTGGVCWVMGDHVKGGLYGQYPSLKEGDLEDGGDLLHTVDFRSVYATMLEKWLGMDSKPIVGGTFEQLDFLN